MKAVVACRDCVHRRRWIPDARCLHQEAIRSPQPRWDLGESEPGKARYLSCETMRGEYERCGPEARLFELGR